MKTTKTFCITTGTESEAIAKEYEMLRDEPCPACGSKSMAMTMQVLVDHTGSDERHMIQFRDHLHCSCGACGKEAVYEFLCTMTERDEL